MRKSRGIASVLMAVLGVVMAGAGPVLALQGVQAQREVRHELAAQKIAFPTDQAKLPDALKRYAGEKVTTGGEAKAYAEFISAQVAQATGGRTYQELSAQPAAGGQLTQAQQTALMGEALRGSLLSANQAENLSWLLIGLGVLLTAIGAVFALTGFSMRPPRIVVPDSPEALESLHLRLR
ncbi:hypothetical protein EV385_4081 [Krasilnikovia cinnamomea]|uniref:Uncharacterized protein n=1 Tax=Krasilnikovia cinnamomea TaxID=349313 RepID=A0A4Q7ZNI3_9ACTN|nr:hypothetical protein [Krasilnikovia cinnamomea]RZU52234.1 hypothetical protein EV385_4081 [Krasilnikovia cinnamomea]